MRNTASLRTQAHSTQGFDQTSPISQNMEALPNLMRLLTSRCIHKMCLQLDFAWTPLGEITVFTGGVMEGRRGPSQPRPTISPATGLTHRGVVPLRHFRHVPSRQYCVP